jgi:hypothetical protein
MTQPQDAPRQPAVSPKTEQALRQAMDRLFSHRPRRTDGRLIKDNLWKEAGVSRATMNRATTVLAEWDHRQAATNGAGPPRKTQTPEVQRLRQRLRKSSRRCHQLQQQVDAAATVIAALYANNTALREQLAARTTPVRNLDLFRANRD